MRHLFLVYLTAATLSASPLCPQWSKVEKVGNLSIELLPEASGLAVSRQFPDRIYHHNDSGDGPYFYRTNRKGKASKTIEIKDFDPVDVEDIAIGPCGKRGDCLFLSDTGDNDLDRDYAEIVVIKEQETFPEKIQATKILEVHYTNGPQNVEALVSDPSGNLFLFTKEGLGEPTQIYKIASEAVATTGRRQRVTAEKVGKIEIAELLGGDAQISGADLSPDGTRLLLLSKSGNAVELAWKSAKSQAFGTSSIKLGKKKTEGIGYIPNMSGFLFSVESKGNDEIPLSQVTCLHP